MLNSWQFFVISLVKSQEYQILKRYQEDLHDASQFYTWQERMKEQARRAILSHVPDRWEQLWKWFVATHVELELDQQSPTWRIRVKKKPECGSVLQRADLRALAQLAMNRRIGESERSFQFFSRHAARRMQLSRESAMEAYESSIRRKHILAEHQREDWAAKCMKPSKCHQPQIILYICIIYTIMQNTYQYNIYISIYIYDIYICIYI